MANYTKEKGYLEDELKIKVYNCECPLCNFDNEVWESELILEADIEKANKLCPHYVTSDREDFTFDGDIVVEPTPETDSEYCDCQDCTCQNVYDGHGRYIETIEEDDTEKDDID